jgi:hypothetical protein
MSPLEIIGIIAAVAAPISGIVVAIIVDQRTKRKGLTEAENAENATAATLAAIEVDEKEAHNHEVAIIIEGFTSSLQNLRAEISDTRLQLAEAREMQRQDREARIKLENEVYELKAHQRQDLRDKAEMMRHILDLEKLVPTPPGPPTRPQWRITVPGVG